MIYYDAETRKTWQPVLTQLFDLDKARLIVVNRYETIYRQAAFLLTQKDQNQTSALKVMLDATRALTDLLGVTSEAQAQLTRERMKHYDELFTFYEKLHPEIFAPKVKA